MISRRASSAIVRRSSTPPATAPPPNCDALLDLVLGDAEGCEHGATANYDCALSIIEATGPSDCTCGARGLECDFGDATCAEEEAALCSATSARRSVRVAIALLEFRAEDPKVPIKTEHKMSRAQMRRELEANGFVEVRSFDELPWQHLVFYALKRRQAPTPSA